MGEQRPNSVADASATRQGLASLLDAMARFQSAALLYPATHRRVAESSTALVESLRRAGDLRGEVRLAIVDGELTHDGAPIAALASPARKLVAEWDALGIAKLGFLPGLVPDDLVAFARFLKEATTQIVGGHRPTLASFGLVPHAIDIVSRDYGRPNRADAQPAKNPDDAGKGGAGTGSGTGDGVGAGSLQQVVAPVDPIDDEEHACRDATAARDAGVPELAVDELAAKLGVDRAAFGPAELTQFDRVAAFEWLLHLLRRAGRPEAFRTALIARIASLLVVHYGEAEQRVLSAGLLPLARADAAGELVQMLDALTPVIRGFGAERPAALLLELHAVCGPQARRVVWLRLVQELLLTFGQNGEAVERKVVALLAQIDPTELNDAASELAALRVIRTQTFVPGALASTRTGLYRLYLAFLRVGGPLSDELLRSFLLHPPPTAAGGAFYALRNDAASARLFLVRFLSATESEEPALRRQAGAMLRTMFESLASEQRNEPWLPSAIAALRRLPSPESERTLKKIRNERRCLFFVPAWPKTCRDAAAPEAP